MTKRTVWFLVVFLGASLSLLFVGGRGIMPSSNLLAQVGVVVGIAPNPYNTLNDQLQQEQTQLNQQAADLAAREAAFASSTASSSAFSSSPVVWYLAIAVAVMAVLVLLNFYFDWRLLQRISPPPPPAAPKE